eukprot:6615073-Pyramimonas_sp.AAC.1
MGPAAGGQGDPERPRKTWEGPAPAWAHPSRGSRALPLAPESARVRRRRKPWKGIGTPLARIAGAAAGPRGGGAATAAGRPPLRERGPAGGGGGGKAAGLEGGCAR